MTHTSQLLLSKDDLQHGQVRVTDLPALSEGAVRLRVESFSVTTNNVTYARLGHSMNYWCFFPVAGESGLCPAWGHAMVIESTHPRIGVGERIFGYLPMATHVDLQPTQVEAEIFFDGSTHRQGLVPVYNRYHRLQADPLHDPRREDARMLYTPLFWTGFSIHWMLEEKTWCDAEQIVLTSASSKTALALAFLTRQHAPHLKRVGLTSAAHLAFAESTGLYDTVLAYEAIASLPAARAVLVDFTSSQALITNLYFRLRHNLVFSCIAGLTQATDASAFQKPAESSRVSVFFAPEHMDRALLALGPEVFSSRYAAGWNGFLSAMQGVVGFETVHGLLAAAEVFADLLSNRSKPEKAHLVHLV